MLSTNEQIDWQMNFLRKHLFKSFYNRKYKNSYNHICRNLTLYVCLNLEKKELKRNRNKIRKFYNFYFIFI
jgi:hypothetical protein